MYVVHISLLDIVVVCRPHCSPEIVVWKSSDMLTPAPPLAASMPHTTISAKIALLQVNTNMGAYKQQLQSFISFVQEQRHLPTLKQFLKLYTSIALAKLASLMDMDGDTLRQQLEVLKVSS